MRSAPGTSKTNSDYLIVGGGIIGCSLARELARTGAQVVELGQRVAGVMGSDDDVAAAVAESARRAGHPRQAIAAYEKAVRLYRGPLFEDDPAGEWFLAEQRHLEELYLQALEHLATVHFELGELPEAIYAAPA